MGGTPDADSRVSRNEEQFVAVAETEHLLVRGFLKRITTFHLGESVGLLSREKQVFAHLSRLFHQLSHAVDTFIICGNIVRLCSFRHSLVMHDVFLLAHLDEDLFLHAVHFDVPGVLRLLRAHNRCRCRVCHEDLCLLGLGQFVDDAIFPEGRLGVCLAERRNSLPLTHATLVPLRIVGVNASGSHFRPNLTGFQIWQLILSLLAKFANNLPLRLHIHTTLSEASSAVEGLALGGGLTRLVRPLSLLLPFLTFLGLLRSLVHNLVRFTLFLLRRLQLLLVSQRSLDEVSAASSLVSSLLDRFLVLDSLEFVVFRIFDEG